MVESESHSSYESSFEDDASSCVEDEKKVTDKNTDSLSTDNKKSIHNELDKKDIVLVHPCNTKTKICGINENIPNQSHNVCFDKLSENNSFVNRCVQDAKKCPNVTFSDNDSLKNQRFIAWEIAGQKDPSPITNIEREKCPIGPVKNQDYPNESGTSNGFNSSGSADKLHNIKERERDIRSLPNDIALSNITSFDMKHSEDTNDIAPEARNEPSLDQHENNQTA